uniref:Uncharacterized protein n=1 Tax=Timema monikensis TaxID=170555 RepID=A0A7R9HMK7_9NEOP|nr:unnamed protein product [Timema monikensis]
MNDMVVRTQSRLDGKWLKLDLQWAFNPDGLSQLWNEMVKDCELTGSFSDGLLNAVGIVAHKGESGHYYCGLRVLTCPCCDGICGPNTGCNCPACQRLDQEEAARTELRGTTPLPSLPQIESWTWGPQPRSCGGVSCHETSDRVMWLECRATRPLTGSCGGVSCHETSDRVVWWSVLPQDL